MSSLKKHYSVTCWNSTWIIILTYFQFLHLLVPGYVCRFFLFSFSSGSFLSLNSHTAWSSPWVSFDPSFFIINQCHQVIDSHQRWCEDSWGFSKAPWKMFSFLISLSATDRWRAVNLLICSILHQCPCPFSTRIQMKSHCH